MIACENGSLKKVELLLQEDTEAQLLMTGKQNVGMHHYFSLQLTSRNQAIALHVACQKNRLEIVRCLLRSIPEVQVKALTERDNVRILFLEERFPIILTSDASPRLTWQLRRIRVN
jgi:hypothetical protein